MDKKILVVSVICFILFLQSNCNAAGISVDGYEWQKFSNGMKIGFVHGWSLCGKAASDNLMIYPGKNSKDLNNSIDDVNRQMEVFKNEGVLIGGVTLGQVTDTIDKIYSDARVMDMDISKIMPLVSGRLIQGWTEKELDEVIAFNVKLKQCEKTEKEQTIEAMKQGKTSEGCGSIRKAKNSYLEKLKKQ
jgi:translation initiation factor 2 beta subunit (eIF-2beta)/eIF-5